jgi:hypothetical protein
MSKQEIDTVEALKEKDAFYRMGITIETGERIGDHPEAFITYKFTYRCRDCGKTWSKFKVEEVELPREYLESEEEKADYDGDAEEEEAREEQFASED